ncbi:hypothetical protein D9757_013254 [Collybiopsis confluens]|uniref:Uncharacterized protein n=1 Tax=Collybiopsis confluens TaxID=2823264 RepID=A0A8H5GHX1_9AGAR|nr:hypothetical protein D9757_012602 [Collybiopsis confluens]KAF5369240.1 hypothetical protein D9757_013254 [Collybiopsis confluens]
MSMSISTINTTVPEVPETREQVIDTISEFQSMETSYSEICNRALESIEAFLSYPGLDEGVREKLRILLLKISQKKDQILSLISQAQDTLDSAQDNSSSKGDHDEEDDGNDTDSIDSRTMAEYEETINEFTAMTTELNQQLALFSAVVSVKN